MMLKRLSNAIFATLILSGTAAGQTEQKLTASDAAANDWFGNSVSVDGDTAIVGAFKFPNDSSAYIFSRNQGGPGEWGQVAKLTAANATADDWFGFPVSVDGDTAIVGATGDDDAGNDSGSAYIFSRNQGGVENWGQVAKLTALDADGGELFGISVSVNGDTVIVGAHGDNDAAYASGSAYLFSRNLGGPNNWGQVAKLTASDAAANDRFGRSVSVDGDTAMVGAFLDDDAGGESGSAYIFSRNQGGADTWGQVTKLTASDAAAGDFFGRSVSVNGDTAIVGADQNDDAGSASGSAYIFSRNLGGPNNWGQVTKLTAPDAAEGDLFGISVSVNGDTAIAGAQLDDDAGGDSGSTYIFSRNFGGANNWGQVSKLTTSDAEAGDNFGNSVSVNGDTAIVGARSNDDAGDDSGSAYIFFGIPIFQDGLETGDSSRRASVSP